MGGAHPKMLIEDDGEEWIAKFPRGSNVDQLLVEHACMELARRAGLCVASSRVIPGGIDHIPMVRRLTPPMTSPTLYGAPVLWTFAAGH